MFPGTPSIELRRRAEMASNMTMDVVAAHRSTEPNLFGRFQKGMTETEIHAEQDAVMRELDEHEHQMQAMYRPLRLENVDICRRFRDIGVATSDDTRLFASPRHRGDVRSVASKLGVWAMPPTNG